MSKKTIPAPTMEAIWKGITRQEKQKPERVARIIKRGCVLSYEIEDYLLDVGIWCTDWRRVLEAMCCKQVTLLRRPRANQSETWGSEGLALTGMAMLMIELQIHGIAADPQPLVDVLRPALAKQEYLTNEELRIYWHKREHQKMFTTLTADGAIEKPARFTTPVGYKCVLDNNPDGKGVLFVAGPRTFKKDFESNLLGSGAGWHNSELRTPEAA